MTNQKKKNYNKYNLFIQQQKYKSTTFIFYFIYILLFILF